MYLGCACYPIVCIRVVSITVVCDNVIGNVFVYFTIEFKYLRVVCVGASEVVSIVDFCEDMRRNGFISIVYVSSGDEFFVCMDYSVCDEFCFVMNVV